MKFFAVVLLSLFVPISQAHFSTETVTYKIEGVEFPHPAPGASHYRYLHQYEVSLWEHEEKAFNHIIDNLDRRIDHLNTTLKSLYLITCGSALARPDECTRLAAKMHELLAYDKSHVTYTCPFNLVTDLIPVFHDNNLFVDRQGFVNGIVHICGEFDIQNQTQLSGISTFMKNWVETDDASIIYDHWHTYSVRANFNTFGFIDAYRASTPR